MIDVTRRMLTLGLMGLGGCSATPNLELARHSFLGAKSSSKKPITSEYIAAIPYSTLGVSIGSFAPVVMVLAHVDGEELTWVSSDRAILVTRHSRLMRTRGLKRDLLATEFIDADPLMGTALPNEGHGTKFKIDLNRENEPGVEITSSFSEPKLDVADTILGGRVELFRIDEKIVVHQWRWETINSFWLKPDGRIVKSRQQFCPEVKPIIMERLNSMAA